VSFDLAKYLSLFVAEAAEHLAAFSKGLVELEKAVRAGSGETQPIVDGLFRRAHSLKGMAASMQLEGISALAHKAEDLVDALRKGASGLDAEAVDVLLAAGDALHDMVAAASRGEHPDAPPVLLARLDETSRGRKDVRPDPSSDPAVAPAPPPHAVEAPSLGLAARRIQVEVEVAGSCPVPAVRGFLVVKKLSALGALVRSTPSVEDLKAGRIPGKRLELAIDTAETLQAVERALAQISDIASVSLRVAGGEQPPEKAPAAAAPAAGATDAPRTVRVRTEILDYFLDAVGELLLATARLREVGKTLPASHRPHLDEGVDRLHGIVKDLHDKVMTVRMTPLSVVTERLPRAARDVARKVGKQVDVAIEGAEIEIDRAILEELGDPLVHILRNAVDHGIETPQARLLAGKPSTGRVSVRARRDRDRVILEIADDGKGMDPARLRAAAVARGVLRPDAAAALGDREALQLACLPGVSTAESVTDVSGRGVGLDVVKKTVDTLGGTLEIDSVPGAGTRFTFRLPLTVAVQQVLLVRVGEEVLGLPIAKVHGAAQVELSRLDRSRGAPVLPVGAELVPVHDLSRLLGFPEPTSRGERAVVVAEGADGWIGLAVDALLGQQEAVLKPLGPPLEGLPGLSAVTVLGNGRPVFILDVPRLLAA